MLVALYALILGFVLLLLGGEVLVFGASSLAKRLHLTPAVIGVTVVAIGTSVPEFVISTFAAINGNADIATGNIVGSNIQNISLVLGTVALVYPIKIDFGETKALWWFLIASAFLLFAFSYDEIYSRLDGAALLGLFLLFTWFIVSRARIQRKNHLRNIQSLEVEMKLSEIHSYSIFASISAIFGGIFVLVVGANVVLYGAVNIAQIWGLSERVIGLTVVAFGTSLPELIVSLVAAYRRHPSIAIANILGSNIYNVLIVLGPAALIHPIKINPQILSLDIFVMLGFSLLLFPAMKFFGQINRWYALLLLVAFAAYSTYLIVF